MCQVDVGIFGQVWYRTSPDEFPTAFTDFNTDHKCRNYDAIRQWAEERQLPKDAPEDFLDGPAPGAYIYDGVP
jgi:hypothetical protein